jgi:hypothetical protein
MALPNPVLSVKHRADEGTAVQDEGRLAVGGAAPVAVRLAWVDNLKVAVIAGVVVVHAAMAYLIDADWYYMERTTSQLWPALVGLPGLLGGVFALGPLFLLAGCSQLPPSPAGAPAGSHVAGYCALAFRWCCT